MQSMEGTVPEEKAAGHWDLDSRQFNMVVMTAGGIVTFFIGFVVVMTSRLWLRPEGQLELGISWWFFPLTFGVIVAVIILHELLHGGAFLVFGGKPKLDFTMVSKVFPVAHAAAAAPLKRNCYLAACLFPVVVLTPSLLAAAFLVETDLVAGMLLIAMGMNSGGSIGDIIMARSIRQHTPETVFEDNEHGFTWYVPSASGQ